MKFIKNSTNGGNFVQIAEWNLNLNNPSKHLKKVKIRQQIQKPSRHEWTNLKKIKTDCGNCGFLKLVSLTVCESSFLLFSTFDKV